VQEFSNSHKGQAIILDVQRGNENLQITLTPRENPPEGEGVIGIVLMRTAQNHILVGKQLLMPAKQLGI